MSRGWEVFSLTVSALPPISARELSLELVGGISEHMKGELELIEIEGVELGRIYELVEIIGKGEEADGKTRVATERFLWLDSSAFAYSRSKEHPTLAHGFESAHQDALCSSSRAFEVESQEVGVFYG
jgi:hypothetical protein